MLSVCPSRRLSSDVSTSFEAFAVTWELDKPQVPAGYVGHHKHHHGVLCHLAWKTWKIWTEGLIFLGLVLYLAGRGMAQRECFLDRQVRSGFGMKKCKDTSSCALDVMATDTQMYGRLVCQLIKSTLNG